MLGPGDCLQKPAGYFGGQSVCLCECGIRSQTGPSVVQLGRLNEISGSNINSSASLMRTMRGNCLSKERHYGSACRDRAALFTKVIGHRGLETVHHTSLHFALLFSAPSPSGQLLWTFYLFDFFFFLEQRSKKEKCTCSIRSPNF